MACELFRDDCNGAPTCPFLSRIPTITDIDSRGDRILNVGSNRCEVDDSGTHQSTEYSMRFRVCSRTLARFSPVFAAMLFGSFSEATQEVIDLPEDDARAMLVLLYIAHNKSVPRVQIGLNAQVLVVDHNQFIDDIYNIVVLADKYLATESLGPWTSIWAPRLLTDMESCQVNFLPPDVKCETMEKLLFIASEFGHFDLYCKAFLDLVKLHNKERKPFSSIMEPKGCTDQLRSVKNHTIKKTLDILQQADDELAKEDNSIFGPYRCSAKDPETRFLCRTHTWGVIMIHLKKLGLYPLPRAKDVGDSVDDFINRITHGLWFRDTIHEACGIRPVLTGFLEDARTVDDNLCLPTGPLEIAMRSRATYFGFPIPEEKQSFMRQFFPGSEVYPDGISGPEW
ncbi:hypothetical protein G7054_g9669 [Neopestalotiopsis clavispora]|nr:hypothetical protein G7054_g9669 [Neopestalotiopsis clavispora]